MDTPFDGLGMHLGNLSRLSNAQTRSISAENFTWRSYGRYLPLKDDIASTAFWYQAQTPSDPHHRAPTD